MVATALACTAALVSCSPGPTTSEPSLADQPSGALAPLDTEAMDAVVDAVATESRQVGMVVLIETPEGRYENAWGSVRSDSAEPPDLDTKVRVGSNTKTWTGTVILQLVEEGKLSVDDPVSEYRPDVPNGENITIGQLLDMRSGLYNYSETAELNAALDNEPTRVWTPEELLEMAFANAPYFAPGEGYHYSNTNTVLLGLIAEQLDGKPLQQAFQDRLFGPLGLTDTSFPATTDSSIPDPHSDGFMYGTNLETLGEGNASLPPERLAAIAAGTEQPRNTTVDNPSWAWSAGQGISTASEMATWVKALVTGELLSPATQTLRMDSVQSTDGPGSAGYGYGIAQMGPLYGHIGEIPGYNAFMGYDPDSDVTVVVWGNLAPTAEGAAPASTLARELLAQVYAGPATEATDDIAAHEEANGGGR
ncbi:MAG: serine hydrolase domain-containing protein [Rhodococcus sp. (in: high G+C Gram-positive bacteria)]